MQLEILAVCEYAVTKGPQLTILNTFDDLTVAKVPAKLTGNVVTKIRFQPGDEGRHEIMFRIVDMDGNELNRLGPQAHDIAIHRETRAVVLIGQWLADFERGQHHFQVLVDGEELGFVPLNITVQPAP